MSSESRQHLLDTIEARAVLNGEKVSNQELVKYLKGEK
jgi:hypothetical protein